MKLAFERRELFRNFLGSPESCISSPPRRPSARSVRCRDGQCRLRQPCPTPRVATVGSIKAAARKWCAAQRASVQLTVTVSREGTLNQRQRPYPSHLTRIPTAIQLTTSIWERTMNALRRTVWIWAVTLGLGIATRRFTIPTPMAIPTLSPTRTGYPWG